MDEAARSVRARCLAWGALLRISLAPSAAADVVAGYVWAGGELATLAWLPFALASLCLYHGGMALNDWADRAHDARTRPTRPIPSGAVSARSALASGGALVALGAVLACARLDASARWIPLALAFAILAYDLGPRGARLGPLLLAACRGLNLALGIAAAGTSTRAWIGADGARAPGAFLGSVALVPIALYAAYVACVGAIGRHEDAPAERVEAARLRPWVVGAALALIALACVPHAQAGPLELHAWPRVRFAAVALALGACVPLVAAALRTHSFARGEVLALMGALLRRLLACTAVLALTRGTPSAVLAALVILCGYPLAFFLRRIFPPS